MIRNIIVILFMILSGCHAGFFSNSNTDFIVGKWRSIFIFDTTGNGPKIGWELEFSRNGRYSLLSDEGFNIQYHNQGRYSILDQKISFEIHNRDNQWIVDFTCRNDTLVILPNRVLGYHITLIRSSDSIQELYRLPQLPRTVSEAASLLYIELDEASKTNILYQGNRIVPWIHFSYGMYIRNRFGLWGSNPSLIKDCGSLHPDEAWTIILDSLIQRVRSTVDQRLVQSFELQNEVIYSDSLSMTIINHRTLSAVISIINDSCTATIAGNPKYSSITGFHFEIAHSEIADSLISIDDEIERRTYMNMPSSNLSLAFFLSQILYPTFNIEENRDYNVIKLVRNP